MTPKIVQGEPKIVQVELPSLSHHNKLSRLNKTELTPLPQADKIIFKPKFQERYQQLTDWDQFCRYCLAFERRSIRINTLVASIAEVKSSIEAKGWKLTPVPWCPEGFWIEHPERRDVGHLLEHHLGKIYVQEAASMIPL